MHNLLPFLYQDLNNVIIQKTGTVLNSVLPENGFYLNKDIPLVLKKDNFSFTSCIIQCM